MYEHIGPERAGGEICKRDFEGAVEELKRKRASCLKLKEALEDYAETHRLTYREGVKEFYALLGYLQIQAPRLQRERNGLIAEWEKIKTLEGGK